MIRFVDFILELKDLDMLHYGNFDVRIVKDDKLATDDFQLTTNEDKEIITIWHNTDNID